MTREQIKRRAIPLLEAMLDVLMDQSESTDEQRAILAQPYEEMIRELTTQYTP